VFSEVPVKTGAVIKRRHDQLAEVLSCSSLSEACRLANRVFDLETEAPLSSEVLRGLVGRFRRDLSEDVGSDLAEWITSRLLGWVGDTGQLYHVGDLTEAFCSAYHEIAKVWAPLFSHYVYTAFGIGWEMGAREAHIISRDAAPLYPIALAMKRRGAWAGVLRLVQCNRTLFGIPEVIRLPKRVSSQRVRHPFGYSVEEMRDDPIYTYLRGLYGNKDRILWIETGYHGTLVKKIADLDLASNLIVFFFSSSNPNIFGYANVVVINGNLCGVKVPYDFIYIMGDQIESLAKLYKNVRVSHGDTGLTVEADNVSPLYGVCAMAAYWTLGRIASGLDLSLVDPWEETLKLYELSLQVEQDGRSLPYVLPEFIPGWAEGLDFLKKEFDLGPVPPMTEWWAP